MRRGSEGSDESGESEESGESGESGDGVVHACEIIFRSFWHPKKWWPKEFLSEDKNVLFYLLQSAMPALLSDAYGTTFAQNMQAKSVLHANAKKSAPPAAPAPLGATTAAPAGPEAPASAATVSGDKTPPHRGEGRGGRGRRGGRRDNSGQNYEIHITIDQQDCHLLCLFIGVFTLSVLFNSNKRQPSA